MISQALAQNLVAIGMADLIQRAYKVASDCGEKEEDHCYGLADCCQEKNVDTFAQSLEYLGASEETLYGD